MVRRFQLQVGYIYDIHSFHGEGYNLRDDAPGSSRRAVKASIVKHALTRESCHKNLS